MANVYDIIIRPIITERSMADVANKKYVFEVARDADAFLIEPPEMILGLCVAGIGGFPEQFVSLPVIAGNSESPFVEQREFALRRDVPRVRRQRKVPERRVAVGGDIPAAVAEADADAVIRLGQDAGERRP